MQKFTYRSNNSGGKWWLDDADWEKLEKAGWDIHWFKNSITSWASKNGRFLDALANGACKEFHSIEEAINEFETITGQNFSSQGCNCCGPPHTMRDYCYNPEYHNPPDYDQD